MKTTLHLVAYDEKGAVTNNQVRVFHNAQDLGDFILCQNNNDKTRRAEITIDFGPATPERKHRPAPDFARRTRAESLALMAAGLA